MQVWPALVMPPQTARVGRGVDVGVGVDDHGVLAATLDEHRRQRLRARGRMILARRAGRAGEGHLVHTGADQVGTGLAGP